MAQLKNLIVNGTARILGPIYAPLFKGPLEGNAATATKATQDGSGNNIANTYATKSALNSVSSLVGDKAVSTQISEAVANKADKSHTHNYAGSSSAGGSATSAVKLDSSAGSTTQPVYFSGGKPTACTYTLGKSVPSNAVFTDTNTHYASKNVVGSSTATSNTTSALSNGNVYLNSVENGAVTSAHKISGSGATTVTTDTSGNIVITSTDNNTTYSAGTGISLSGTTFSNSGVRSIATGSSNGTISVNTNGTTANVAVKGLGSAAYTASTAYGSATDVSNLKNLVGDTAVSTQINNAIASKADLDTNGKVLSSQLPSYVDDVLEYNGKSNFPSTGETGKIYVDIATNLTYRWSGSAYVEISPTLALGETSSTAYRGDRGKVAYDHSQTAHAPSNANYYAHPTYTAKSSGLYKVTVDGTGHVSAATAVAKSDITGLGIPAQDTTYSVATTSANGLMSSTDKTNLNSLVTKVGDSSVSSQISTAITNSASTTTPKVAGTAAVGSENKYARGDHVHPVQTSVSGNAGTATKLATARTIALTGSVTGSGSFDGSGNLSIATTANHTHSYIKTTDTRNDNPAPNSSSFTKNALSTDFKYVNKINSPTGFGGTYCGLISFAPWSETSGGNGYQIAVGYNSDAHPRLAVRSANLSATSWGSWYKIYTSDDKPTLSELGAAASNHTHSNATTSAAGFMSATDKTNLDGLVTKVGDTAVSSQITTATNDCITGLSVSGKTITYTKKSGSTGTITTQDTNTTYSTMTGATSSAAGTSGLVPAPASGKQTSFLRGDGTWVVPTNTTYSNMTGATTSVAGASGLVPAPSAGTATRYLRSDGTWQVPPDTNTTYSAATTSAAGLMSASDKSKLDGIATGATKVTVDSALSSSSTNPVQNKVVNTEISSLKSLVGDTAVSTQISNAVANNATKVKSITIPASGWTLDSTTNFYKTTINDSSVTANDVVEINLNLSSITIAENCGLKSVVESDSGKLYLYAKSVPSGAMSGTMIIIKG